MLLANVPLPSWRPDPVAALSDSVSVGEAVAPDPEEDEVASVLLAMAEGPVNAPRSITIGAPPPERRSEPQATTEDGDYSVAGLPVKPMELEAEVRESKARLAALSSRPARAAAVVAAGRDARAIGVVNHRQSAPLINQTHHPRIRARSGIPGSYSLRAVPDSSPLGNLCKLPFLDGVGIGIGIGIDAFHAVFLGTSRLDTDTDSDSDPDSGRGATCAEFP